MGDAARGSCRSLCRSIPLVPGNRDRGRKWGQKNKIIRKRVSRQWMAEGRNFRKLTDVGAFEAVRKKKIIREYLDWLEVMGAF